MRLGPRFAAFAALFCLSATAFSQCPAGTTVPSVHICSPTNNATVGTEVTVTATAVSNFPISAMKVYVDGVSVYTFHDSSINTDLLVSEGAHRLTVKAWDTGGGVFSSVVNITATDGGGGGGECTAGAANTVRICAPASGTTLPSPVDVEAYVNATSTVQATKIYVDGTSVWSGTSPQVTASLAMNSGSHKITVKGWTTAGTVLASSVTFNVSTTTQGCTAGAAESVKICSPASGATVSSPVDVEAFVNTASTVQATKIYVDGTSVWSGTSKQVSANLSMSGGAHKVTVKGWTTAGTVLAASVNFSVGTGGGGGGGFAVTPRRYTATPNVPVQFSATGATAWSVDGITGGDAATVGTIDETGLYTPPATTGQHTISATDGTNTATAAVWVSTVAGIYTYKYDERRSGVNTSETVLTPANVQSGNFGKLGSFPVDGYVVGQPVYRSAVTINGQPHNVVYVATLHDSVYAFDADARQSAPLWKRSFLNSAAGVTTYPPVDTCCVPEVGIASTMTIDPATGTLFTVVPTKEGTTYVYRLHALDSTTGADLAGSPVVITASVAGTGDSSTNGVVNFDPYYHLQRPALLLSNGALYIGFGSYNDVRPYHGWLMAYDASTLAQIGVWCATPNGYEGGLWQSGGGPSVDESGAIYISTGNGTYTAAAGGRDFGQSIVKFDHNLNVLDFFTPFDFKTLNQYDRDVGASHVVLLPSVPTGAPTHLAVNVNKGGDIYVMDYDMLGHNHPTDNSQIFQTLSGFNMIRETPAYWNNNLYFVPLDSPLMKYTLSATGFASAGQSSFTFPFPGSSPVISANGSADGVLWTTKHSGGAAILYAIDPNTLSVLWESDTKSSDTADISVRFSVPMIVNGRVYLAGKTSLVIYGMLP